MIVPKYIEDKMRRAHRHFQAGIALMFDVNEWFDTRGYDVNELRDGDGNSMEEIEYGAENAVDNFLEKLKNLDRGQEK